jgi:membrane protein YdbS with pleckstrin-like domain
MRRALWRLLKLSERPQPPPGAGPSLHVFHASRRYFRLRASFWALRQAAATVGILFSLVLLATVKRVAVMTSHNRGLEMAARDVFASHWPQVRAGAVAIWGWVEAFEVLAVAVFLVGAALSWALLELDWEARWYMVSDESLRIREGLLRTHERTMTVANIQNLTIRRGPLQKIFRIADLEVRTAGGGAPELGEEHEGPGRDLHVGRFRGIEDVEALRDRIQASLLRHRDSGLGDPDEVGDPDGGSGETPALPARPLLLPAAQELLHATRGLRAALETLAQERGGADARPADA